MRKEKGITLLVLTITVLVLLILASIVINEVLDDDGIFQKSDEAKILSRVQALDDTIKAYTFKSDDPYSSSKKSIDDLISEGILKKITLSGNRSIYYVNFENKNINVAEKLGLTSKDYKNKVELTSFKVNELSELQDKGIYVVDNDLNAAYLANAETYGTLVNFGGDEVIDIYPEFASQSLILKVSTTQDNNNTNTQTNTSNSHSIMTMNSDTNTLEEFTIHNVNSIVLELTHVTDDSKSITMTFEKDATSMGGIYALEEIYNETDGHIKLESAWQCSNISPGELTNKYNKVITVYTDG